MPSTPFHLRCLGACLLLALGAAAGLPAMGGNPPSGLPGHFAFGVFNLPGGAGSRAWMDATRSGNNAQWDYRYTYFNAGVNTGWGWATWNSPAGQYASLYLSDSDAGGYIPVLVYYQMLQSLPASGGTESDMDYNNLNNASTMNAYYADYKLLLQKAAAFNKPVIVHIEPDLFGYMQKDHCGGTDNAANCPASVASSGHADAAGLPNTFAGYCQALRRMRDTYAPKVRLAMHASWWASGQDLMAATWMTQAQIDAEADRTIAFLTSCDSGSPGKFDLFFFEFSDRDASYKYSIGNTTYWWDPVAANLGGSPNTFARHVHLVDRLSSGLGLRGMGWQIPCGNTTYRTCNNAGLHWRSPYAEYILGGYPGPAGASHVRDYAQAGAVGMLSGAGANDQTHPWDEAGDGVTNGANVANDGSIQGGAIATVGDDDGGYIRVNVGAYYTQGSYPLAGAPSPTRTVTPTPAVSATPTPSPTPDCPRAFNRCEALAENGVWSGTGAVRSLDAGVPGAVTDGVSCLKAQITAPAAWWNEQVMNLAGFNPAQWSSYNAVSFDLYVDPAALPWTGASSSHKIAVHASVSTAGKWSQPITDDWDLQPGANHITAPLQWGLGSVLPSDLMTQIQFNLKIDDPQAGVLYLDHVELHTGGACPPSPTASPTRSPSPTGSPTRSASPTGTASASASPTPTRSASPTPSPSPSASPSVPPTGTPPATGTASPTGSATATASSSASPSPSAGPSATASPSATMTPAFSPSASPTHTSAFSPSASPTHTSVFSPSASPTQTSAFSPTASPSHTPGQSPTATATSTPSPTAGAPSPSATPSATLSRSPSPEATATPSATGDPSVTASASPSRTAGPTASATAVTAATDGTEAAALLEVVALPNPRPAASATGGLELAVKTGGAPRWLEAGLYTQAMTGLGRWQLPLRRDPGGSPWQRIVLPCAGLRPGLYFVRVRIGGGSRLCRVVLLP